MNNIKYWAVVNEDLSGPIWGIGLTKNAAIKDALNVISMDGLDTTFVAEITKKTYDTVKNGNPDNWELIN